MPGLFKLSVFSSAKGVFAADFVPIVQPPRVGKMLIIPNTAMLYLGQISPKFTFPEIRQFLWSVSVVANDLKGLWNRHDFSSATTCDDEFHSETRHISALIWREIEKRVN